MTTATERSTPIGSRLTLEEWADLPEEDEGELVDGYLVEEEVTDFTHALVTGWLIRRVGNWLEGHGGFIGGPGPKFAVGPRRGRIPDATVYLPASKPPPPRGLIRNPPDIAIEVVSPIPQDQRRDRIEKPDDYAGFGVRFYWIIDPLLCALEVFELGQDGRYIRAVAASSGSVEIPGCEGLILPLDQLWAELDKLRSAAGES